MSGRTDRFGVAQGTSVEAALEHFDAGVVDLVALAGDPSSRAEAALGADPGFLMAAVLRSYLDLYVMTGTRWRSAAQRLAGFTTTTPPTRRELLHRDAALAWSGGELERAQVSLEWALVLEPRDLLALKVAQDLAFFRGDRLTLRDVVARVRAAWPAGGPAAGYVAGLHAFGWEENADYRQAEAAATEALSADPADVWAVHALAHVFEMEGRAEEGIEFLRGSAEHWSESFFAVHNWWHLALFHLELDDPGGALRVYDDTIADRVDGVIWLDLVDAASLLWRLTLLGHDVGRRAVSLADSLDRLAPDSVWPFDDWHAVMGFCLAGRVEDARAVLDRSTRTATGTAARTLDLSGRDVLTGFVRFAEGQSGPATSHLFEARPRSFVLGGSHAQRDAIDLTLVAAASAAGDRALERALVEERRAWKPSSEPLLARIIRANRHIG